MTRSIYRVDGLKSVARTWEVQRAPFREPLPFSYAGRIESQYPFASPGQVNDFVYTRSEPVSADYSRLSNVVNLARSNAVSQIKQGRSAALGLTLLDYKSSLSLITGALKSLSSKADRKTLYYKKRSSQLYLEGVFGWLPLMQDIYDAFNVLDGAHRSAPARGKSSMVYSTRVTDVNHRLTIQTELGALVGAQGMISDPNLALLGDLGLVNPAAIAWDKVPYSFVVNWFIPIGGYLSSFTDLVGYDIFSPFVTTFVKKTASGSIRVYHPDTSELVWRERFVTSVYVTRTWGFPTPSFPPFQLPSADLFKSLVTLSLLNENLRKPARHVRGAFRGRHKYTE